MAIKAVHSSLRRSLDSVVNKICKSVVPVWRRINRWTEYLIAYKRIQVKLPAAALTDKVGCGNSISSFPGPPPPRSSSFTAAFEFLLWSLQSLLSTKLCHYGIEMGNSMTFILFLLTSHAMFWCLYEIMFEISVQLKTSIVKWSLEKTILNSIYWLNLKRQTCVFPWNLMSINGLSFFWKLYCGGDPHCGKIN